MENKLNYKQFYKELGHLLYAISSYDGKIRKKEVEELREFVLKKLAPLEKTSDSSGMNLAFYTQFEFDDIAKKTESPIEVYFGFINYLKKHSANISDELKNSIIESVEAVAKAYKKTNKKEQEMISNLKEELKSI